MYKPRDLKDYFLDERDFILELGVEFARKHAGIAAGLREPGRDPDVERLIDGMAFLNARTRMALDAELPELLNTLLAQLWPHMLRPTPATMIVQFAAKSDGGLQVGCQIGANRRVLSHPLEVDASHRPCRMEFRTCYDVQVLPLQLIGVALEDGTLLLQLKTLPKASLQRLLPPMPGRRTRLRLSLHGEPRQAYGLYWALLRNRGISLHAPQANLSVSSYQHEELRLLPLGHRLEESILPYKRNGFSGFRHLYEYFAFPEKFLFFDLEGLDVLERKLLARGTGAPCSLLEIRIALDPPPLHPISLGSNPIRLFCTPAVNLFEHRAETLRVEHNKFEHELKPLGGIDHYDIFSVEEVVARDPSAGQAGEQTLSPFESFTRARQLLTKQGGAAPWPMYQVRRQPPLASRVEPYHAARTLLSLVDTSGDPQALALERELWLDVKLLATNGNLPAEHLGDGMLAETSMDLPEGVRATNVGRPTEGSPVPVGSDGRWRFVAMLVQGWNLAADIDVLRELFVLNNPQAHFSGRARIRLTALCDALEKIEVKSGVLPMGKPPTVIQGSQILLKLKDRAFDHPGQLLLFGHVLNHFFAAFSTINTFSQLTLTTHALAELPLPALVGEEGMLSLSIMDPERR